MKGENLVRREKWRSFRIFCSTEKLASRHKRFSSVETLAKIPRNSTYVSFWFSLPPQMTYGVLLVISNPNFTPNIFSLVFRGFHRRCINKLGTQKRKNPKTGKKFSYEVLIGHRRYVVSTGQSHDHLRRCLSPPAVSDKRVTGTKTRANTCRYDMCSGDRSRRLIHFLVWVFKT